MLGSFKFVFSLIPLLMLVACGGGGDSSSGGGGDNPYAGTYYGKLTVCMTLGGAKNCESAQSAIIISNDGSVTEPGNDLTGKMDGNKYSIGGKGSETVDGMTCLYDVSGSGVVNDTNTTGSMSGPFICDGTRLESKFTWNMNKGTARALNLPSAQEAIHMALSRALGRN